MPKDFNYEIGSEGRLNENESLIYDKYNTVIGRKITYGETTKYYDLSNLEIAHECESGNGRKTIYDNCGNSKGFCVESNNGYDYYDNTGLLVGSSNRDNMLGNAFAYNSNSSSKSKISNNFSRYDTGSDSEDYTSTHCIAYNLQESFISFKKTREKEEFDENVTIKAMLPVFIEFVVFFSCILLTIFSSCKALSECLQLIFDFSFKHIFLAVIYMISIKVLIFTMNKISKKSVRNINCDWVIEKINEYNKFLERFKKNGVNLYGEDIHIIKNAIEFLSKIEGACIEMIERGGRNKKISISKIEHLKKELGTLIFEFKKLDKN